MKKFLILFIVTFVSFMQVAPVFAQDVDEKAKNNEIKLLAPIGEKDAVPIPEYTEAQGGYSIAIVETYLQFLYPYAAMLLVSITVLMTVVGSIEMITAGGDSAKVTSGKDRIMYAILGLLLFLFSSVILWSINPNFFVFQS